MLENDRFNETLNLGGIYTSNLFNDLDFYLGQLLCLYKAKYLCQIISQTFCFLEGQYLAQIKLQIVKMGLVIIGQSDSGK